jgi:hypothetical protein
MAKAYLLEAQRSPPGPAAPPAPVPPAVDDPRVRLGHDVRRIARAALGISAHVTTALPLAFATRISLLGQRAEARLVVPALARAVRLAARFDRGPVPRAATHEELVRVLAPRGGPGTPS